MLTCHSIHQPNHLIEFEKSSLCKEVIAMYYIVMISLYLNLLQDVKGTIKVINIVKKIKS